MNPTLIKNHVAGAAIAAYRIVKHGTADGKVRQGTADTDVLIGVSGELEVATGERIDITRAGIAEVEYGDTVTRGDYLTTDSVGKAVPVAAAAAVNAYVIGIAEVSGVDGDIGSVMIAPGVVNGAGNAA